MPIPPSSFDKNIIYGFWTGDTPMTENRLNSIKQL